MRPAADDDFSPFCSFCKHTFKQAFKSLEINKASGCEGLDVNIITSLYELIETPFLKSFNEPQSLGIFQENMNIANAASIFKSGRK